MNSAHALMVPLPCHLSQILRALMCASVSPEVVKWSLSGGSGHMFNLPCSAMRTRNLRSILCEASNNVMIKHVILTSWFPGCFIVGGCRRLVWSQHTGAVSKIGSSVRSVRRYLKFSWIQFRLEDVTHVGFLDLDIFAAGERNRLPVLKGNK